MDKIYYNELLNHYVIKKMFLSIGGSSVFVILFLASLINGGRNENIWAMVIIAMIIIGTLARYMEISKLQEFVTFYNDSIENNNFLEVDDELKYKYTIISEYTILSRLEVVCEPEFVYDDETRIYKAENKDIVIINGYFEDVSFSKDNIFTKGIKRKYTMVFVDFNYYMCYIDNLICYEKGARWARFYTKTALKADNIDLTKW